jgi:murein hydrolase activator
VLGADTPDVQQAKEAELKKLRQKISDLQQDLEKTSASQSEAADALRDSERAISKNKRRLSELTAQQRSAILAQKNLQQRSLLLEHDLQAQQEMLGQLLYQQYLAGGQQEFIKLLFSDPNQTMRDVQYYQYIARSRALWLTAMRKNLRHVNEVTAAHQQKTIELTALHAEEKIQKRELEKDRIARQQVMTQYAQQLKQQRREINRLQKNEARLAQLLKRLAELLASQQSGNHSTADSFEQNHDFEKLRGRLTLPVNGIVTNKFGDTRPDSTIQWKGLQLRAASGQVVKTIAPGRVVYADWLRGFGNLLIVDHGKGYMSLYANNETLYKQVGDALQGGDTIAAVGNSGGNEDFGLYFELRHEGKPLDPMKWLEPMKRAAH